MTSVLKLLCSFCVILWVSFAQAQATTLYQSSNIIAEGVTAGYGSSTTSGALYNGADCNTDAIAATFTGSAADYCTKLAKDQFNKFFTVDILKCYNYSATLSSITCSQRVCTYGGGCSQQPYSRNVCNVSVTVSDNATATYHPAYIVQSLDYTFPGNKSSITYTSGVVQGTTWEVKTSQGATVTVSAGISLGGDSGGGSGSGGGNSCSVSAVSAKATDGSNGKTNDWGGSTSYGFETCSDDKTSLQNSFSGTAKYTNLVTVDPADHLKDTFTLWVNPELVAYAGCNAPDTIVYGLWNPPWISDSQAANFPQIMSITVFELLNPDTVTDSTKKSFLTAVNAADSTDISLNVLSLDPFIDINQPDHLAKAPVFDPNRYRSIQLQTNGVFAAQNYSIDATKQESWDVKYTYSQDNTDTTSQSFSISAGASWALWATSAKYNFSLVKSKETVDTNNNSASIALQTTTAGVCITGQILFDTIFNTYVVTGEPSACADAPSAPTNFTAVAQSSTSAALSWQWVDTTGSGSSGFSVERSPVSGDTGFNVIASPVAGIMTYTDTGLSPNTTYWYRVRATNVYGNSEYSPSVSVTTAVSIRLTSFTLDNSSVVGSVGSCTGTLTINAAAPKSGVVVTLTTSNAAVATVPANVTIPNGATTATFTVGTSSVQSASAVTLTATLDKTVLSALLTVTNTALGVGGTSSIVGSTTGTTPIGTSVGTGGAPSSTTGTTPVGVGGASSIVGGATGTTPIGTGVGLGGASSTTTSTTTTSVGTSVDSAGASSTTTSTTASNTSNNDCACSVPGAPSRSGLAAMLGVTGILALVMRRRERKAAASNHRSFSQHRD